MNELIFIVENAPEGGYTARAVGETIFTQGEDWDDLRAMIEDAIECHFDDPAQRPDRGSLLKIG